MHGLTVSFAVSSVQAVMAYIHHDPRSVVVPPDVDTISLNERRRRGRRNPPRPNATYLRWIPRHPKV